MVDGSYEIGGTPVGIRATSKPFGELLDKTLARYRGESAPAIYSVVVADGTTGKVGKQFHVLYRVNTAVLRTLHFPTLVAGLLSELEAQLHPQRDDAIYLNATLVSSNGSLALGPSALTFHFDQLGRRVERAGLAIPASRYVAVDAESGQLLPIEPRLELKAAALERLTAVHPGNDQDTRYRLTIDGPRRVDAVLGFLPTPDGAVAPMSNGQALQRLAQSAVNLRRLGIRGLEGLARLVGGARSLALGPADSRGVLEGVSEAFRIL